MVKPSDFPVKSVTVDIMDFGRVALGHGSPGFDSSDIPEKEVKVSQSATARQKDDDSNQKLTGVAESQPQKKLADSACSAGTKSALENCTAHTQPKTE